MLRNLKKITIKRNDENHIIKIQKDEYGNLYIKHDLLLGVLKINYDDFKKKSKEDKEYFYKKTSSLFLKKIEKIYE